ncbi:type II toxin-antitoxin system RelE/ParE family toxin [Flavobacterium sp.]|jgi:toxin ParE1/3/4|uniref:type II toxin-antitoxin system RelE/ParE family toxin n=1 Tax=Flavobacterium sp. TaxID=239 RepID=UPI0037BFD8B6
MPRNKYVLSLEADNDLEKIFDYTFEEFGFNQAVKYLDEIAKVFVKIINTPEMGRSRNEIKKSLYSLPIESHVVFYTIHTDHIRIVRVLHGAKDLPKSF